MYIKRIGIRNFRRLQQPVSIDGLSDGLNVIAGDNEEGKSTILRALRAALFDRHTLGGAAAASFQPYGAQLRPEVELTFGLNDGEYRLSKAFCQTPAAELIGPKGHFSGPAAEDALKDLLDFDPPGRGPSDPRHHGVLGLLWVEQGTAFRPVSHNPRSLSTLQRTLEGEVGNVLGGQQGHQLLESVRQAYADFFTATGKPRGTYRQAQEAVAELEAELSAIERQLGDYEQRIEELQRLEESRQRDRREGLLETLQRQLNAAAAEAEHLRGIQRRVQQAELEHRVAAAQHDAAQTQWKQRETLALSLDDTQRRSRTLAQDAEDAQTRLAKQQAACDEKQTAYVEASQRLEEARQRLRQAEDGRRRTQLRQTVADLAARQQKAAEAAKTAADAKNAAAALRVSDDDVKALQRLEQQLFETAAQLQAGAPEVALALTCAVKRDDESVAGDSRFIVTEPTTLDLGELGSLRITPGGTDLARSSERYKQRQRELADTLAALGVADRSEAERLLARKHELLREAEKQQQLALAHAGQDIDQLNAALAEQRAELDRLDKHAPTDCPDLAEAQSAVEKAKQAEQEARAAREHAQTALERAKELAHDTAAAYRHNETTRQSLQTTLDDARREHGDEDLFRAMKHAEENRTTSEQAWEHAKTELTAADPERIELTLAQAQDALTRPNNDKNGSRRGFGSSKSSYKVSAKPAWASAGRSYTRSYNKLVSTPSTCNAKRNPYGFSAMCWKRALNKPRIRFWRRLSSVSNRI
ncbi:hypothetical protein CAI21_03300 [Alkalilimnicola ehrlichii]|uniref:Rad50/SbcC-type AAA domain-containing protein n=1 Tax=Alkalilimnicola ehrlichii TaxID=351052 RepID=A0A3E0X395_9GAMM|nr:AAA family ATPase [Alkalilimnicola ehrlichii]RFA31012.1 hypothetical protein CAI21_03300 [Alkalilimnicola ehrlichii]RFA38965.1 hypothetical protein CAL65_03450 [Alkalilimnicola ehrlichii]